MEKVLDLSKSIYDICNSDIQAKSIFVNLGFKAVSNTKTTGALKNRTLDMIVPIKGKNLDEVLSVFEENGYTIIGREDLEDEDDDDEY